MRPQDINRYDNYIGRRLIIYAEEIVCIIALDSDVSDLECI